MLPIFVTPSAPGFGKYTLSVRPHAYAWLQEILQTIALYGRRQMRLENIVVKVTDTGVGAELLSKY